MALNPDFLIIETYAQLATVVLWTIALVCTGCLFWQRRGRARDATLIIMPSGATTPPDTRIRAALPVAAPAGRRQRPSDFDRLAKVIATAGDHADTMASAHRAAKQKLDTAEMAVQRLLADINRVMTAEPRLQADAPAAFLPRPVPAAPVRQTELAA